MIIFKEVNIIITFSIPHQFQRIPLLRLYHTHRIRSLAWKVYHWQFRVLAWLEKNHQVLVSLMKHQKDHNQMWLSFYKRSERRHDFQIIAKNPSYEPKMVVIFDSLIWINSRNEFLLNLRNFLSDWVLSWRFLLISYEI